MADRQSISNFRLWNENMGVKYDPDDYHERSSFPIKFIEKLRIKEILRFLNAGKNDTILEIGCGAGNMMQAFCCGRLVGIDLSATLLKKAGDPVRAGEPIAIVGNTGELSRGAHLHFELWSEGNPVKPKDYISFENGRPTAHKADCYP